MLAMLPAGKRRWQRVEDSFEKGLGGEGEEEDYKFATDKTRLLNGQSSSAFTLLAVDEAQVHAHEGQAQDVYTELSDFTWRCEMGMHALSHQELGNPDQSKRTHKLNPACPALPIKKQCNHASWQGFKQILKKQFTPPFPFGKGLPPPEELQHLRQRRVEGAMHRSSNVLGTSMNLVERRKLDAKIQNGINKSAFVASSKRGRSKENLPYHHNHNLISVGRGTSKRSIKLGSQERFLKNASKNAEVAELSSSKGEHLVPQCCTKKNGIFRKIKSQAKKDSVILLAAAHEE